MKRGENQDYTINYNTGEVTFTSYCPIYQQNFITISYNYTNRNYTRFLMTGGIRQDRDRLKFGLNWFLENDNKTAPLALNLSDADQRVLANAGNDVARMLAPSATPAEYDVNKILYRKLNNGQGDIYEYSTNPDETLYQVAFTYFGKGKGDYKIQQSSNNGRIFKYVGQNMGDYASVRPLPAPQKSQVFSGHAAYALNDGIIGTNFSVSNYDKNLFSKINNNENFGYAGRIYGSKVFRKSNWQGTSSFEYQHINAQFHILDRINDVEFSRDFNLDQEFNNRTQNRLVVGFLNQWGTDAFINYNFNYLNEQNFYTGIKNDIDFSWKRGPYQTTGQTSYLKTSSKVQKTEFAKAALQTQRMGDKGNWTVGASLEHNLKKYTETQQWDNSSFRWQEVFLQKKIGDSTRTHLLAKIYVRNSDSIRHHNLLNVNRMLGLMTESHIIRTENSQLSAVAHYRKFFYKNNSAQPSNQDFLIGNLVYNQQLFKKGMQLQAFYELGTGQEAQREFQYLKVADGQGVYKWTDYNGDKIQQVDEFELAEYADQAEYIRIYTNTIHYLPSNKNKLSLALSAKPAVIFGSQDEFLKRWNLNLSFNSQNSFYKDSRAVVLNPLKKEDSQILKNQSLLMSAQFNPTDKSGWNGTYRFIANDNLINANFSKEESARTSHFLNIGYWFSKNLRIDWENTYEDANHASELFGARNYKLTEWATIPKATYKLSETIQSEISAEITKNNRNDGDDSLTGVNLTGSLQWAKKRTSVRGSFAFINNDFHGNAYSVVGNQMLNGLKPGKNQVWSVYVDQAINSYIHLNFTYDGRNSGDRTIHMGSMQIKASF